MTQARDETELRREDVHEISGALRPLLAERARKIGAATLHSIGDNARLTRYLRGAHEVCANNNDVDTTSLIEVWIDRTECRTWFLAEIINESPER
jgi:starvation-inducible DNA-binding protein